jgi:2-polyprenyl-6-methoxyphenol hydroxylase-like FAD-dependent oxidoreductase
MSKIRRVLVVGGGVGGLTAATAFAQRGVEVVLNERRPVFDGPGIGLGQPANALRVYDALGVLPEILSTGFIYDHMSIFDPNRELIVKHKFLLGDERIPAVCALSRLRLHEILLAAAQRAGVEVSIGVTISEIHEDNDRVTVDFSNGQTESFDLLAGFDGIRSATRLHLVGTAFAPRPSGYGAWRLQVPRPHYVRGMEFLQGIGSKTGAMALSTDVMYIFHIRPEAPDALFERQDKNRAIDTLRRGKRIDRKHEELGEAMAERERTTPDLAAAIDDDIGDDLLRLVLPACHPVLSMEARVALTLRLLGGLTTPEISRAYFVTEATMQQRIVRAKKTLADAGVAFEMPREAERAERLASVLEVIYLIFNEGYAATAGDDWVRPELCNDALRLGRILVGLVPNEPEAFGLLALMEVQASRFAARIGPDGQPIVAAAG